MALDTFIKKAKLNEKPENSVQISKFLCLIPWHKVSTQFIVASKQFEIIVFNKSPTFILQFFEILEFDCIHPKQKYELLLLMKNYMENNFGFYDDSFYKFLLFSDLIIQNVSPLAIPSQPSGGHRTGILSLMPVPALE